MVLGEARLAILLAVLFTFPAAQPASAVAPPATVVALVMADATVVHWLPPADAVVAEVTYNVYGEVDGALVLLENTKATATVILGKYTRFAVSTVIGTDESDPTYAVGGVCVRTSQVPPLDTDCAAMGVEA